jgi:hypothetical protein
MFVWSVEKCESTCVYHSLNKKWPLKNMEKVFKKISPRIKELTYRNILLIDDYPYKCMGNMPYS